jgi:hypothetical protein
MKVADQQSDLNGSAPDNHVVALLLIDVNVSFSTDLDLKAISADQWQPLEQTT